MKAILVILLVGTTAVLEAAKCTPKGYCQLKTPEAKTLLGPLEQALPNERVQLVAEVWRQVANGSTYDAVIYIKFGWSNNRNRSDSTTVYCLIRISEDTAPRPGPEGPGEVRPLSQPYCSTPFQKVRKALLKMVGG